MPATAITVGPARDREPQPVDRVVDVTSSDLIAIQSFYHRRVEDDATRQDALEQQLWGFTADSSLPVLDARAQLEYSVWIPPGDGENGFAEEQNRLIRLRLNDHQRFLDYGAKFFAVGEAFAQNAMARERLNAAGLPGPGEGAEFWLAGRVPGVALQPTFRRLEKSQGNASLVNETFGLSYAHGFRDGTRLQYLLESSESTTWLDDATAAAHDRQAAAATLKMFSADWSMFLRNARFDEQFEAGRRESGWSWEVGGTLNLLTGLTLSPHLSDQIRDVGAANCLRDSSAGLVLHTSWIDPVAVDLQIQRNRHDSLDGETLATAADLRLRTPLSLWDRAPPGLVMTASVGYRGMQGLAAPTPEEGMSFRVTLDYQPGR